jgi:hypothetical protein
MRASMAFFAGAGTILAAIGLGLGGGFTVASIISPNPAKQESSRVERRKSDDLARAENTQAAPVPYLAATVSAVNVPAVTAPAALARSAAAPPALPANAAPAAPRNDTAAEGNAEPSDAAAAKSAMSSQQPAKSEQTLAPDDANAKAIEGDVRRFSGRKSDRRQQRGDRQWSDRRAHRDQREHERRDNEHDVWNDWSRMDKDRDKNWDRRGRDYRSRDYDSGDYADRRDDLDPPIRMFESPRIKVFGPD